MNPSSASSSFSLPRFVRLVRQQAREQAGTWALFAVISAVGLGLWVLGYCLLPRLLLGPGQLPFLPRFDVQLVVYSWGLMLSGYLLAHQVHGVWRTPETALVYLMLPASTLEKWLLSAVQLLLFWPLVYTALFAALMGAGLHGAWVLDEQLAQQLTENLRWRWARTPDDYQLYWPLRPAALAHGVTRWDQLMWALGYATLMGYAATTLVWLRRQAAMRALVLGIGLLMLTALLWSVAGRGDWLLRGWEQPWRGSLSLGGHALMAAFWLGTPALLWAASWRALREKELA